MLYSHSRPWDKPKYLQHRLSCPSAVFPTSPHELHRHRRAAVSPFFSKRKVSEFGPLLQRQMDRLCKRLDQEYRNTGNTVRLEKMYGCFTADTIILFCFDTAYDWVDATDFHCDFVQAMNDLLEGVHLVTQFPWLGRILYVLPDKVLEVLNPAVKSVNKFNEVSIVGLCAAKC